MTPTERAALHRDIEEKDMLHTCAEFADEDLCSPDLDCLDAWRVEAAEWGIAYGIKQATGLASAEYLRGLKEGIAAERKRAAGVARRAWHHRDETGNEARCGDVIADEIEKGEE